MVVITRATLTLSSGAKCSRVEKYILASPWFRKGNSLPTVYGQKSLSLEIELTYVTNKCLNGSASMASNVTKPHHLPFVMFSMLSYLHSKTTESQRLCASRVGGTPKIYTSILTPTMWFHEAVQYHCHGPRQTATNRRLLIGARIGLRQLWLHK
jgi:hypothetical protein